MKWFQPVLTNPIQWHTLLGLEFPDHPCIKDDCLTNVTLYVHYTEVKIKKKNQKAQCPGLFNHEAIMEKDFQKGACSVTTFVHIVEHL